LTCAEEVAAFIHELRGFHGQFSECFVRSESREHFFNYMAGQFSELERNSIEPIALALKDNKVRLLQRFVSDAPWDDDRIMSKYRSLVNDDLGSQNGALIFDESGFVKKGQDSNGVSRQYCGAIGKVDNCQVGVFAGYVSEHGYALVDKRLFIPKKWFGDDHLERRKKCKLPAETVFQSKPKLAAEMLRDLSKADVLPFKYVLADSLYGVSPEFIAAVEALPGKIYFVSVPKDTQCWLTRSMTITTEYRWSGKKRRKRVLAAPDTKPLSVEDVARNMNDYFWYHRKVSEGTK
jgi:SRSO17 transposase